MACNYIRDIVTDFDNELFDLLDSNAPEEEIRSSAITFFKNLQETLKQKNYPVDQEFLDKFPKQALGLLETYGLATRDLNEALILNLIENPDTPVSNLKFLDNTTESLDSTISTRLDFRRDFIEKIYDGSDIVKLEALKDIDFNFSQAILFDRDHGFITRTSKDLNDNLRNYLERLFITVFRYLKEYYKDDSHRKRALDYNILQANYLNLYDANDKYTGNFERLFFIASNIFNTFDRKKLNDCYLNDKEALKAFNAYETLLHFDEFLLNTFGDAICIADLKNRFVDTDKYELASKATSMFWNNLADDDIDLTKSINNISKLLVTTTRMYDFNTGNMLPSTYVKFNLFITIISKLKDLATKRALVSSVDLLEKNSEMKYINDITDLSENTKWFLNYLKNNITHGKVTLGNIINYSGQKPEYAFPALFEILTSRKLHNSLSEILDVFTNEDKNVILSLANEIYARNREKSLGSVSNMYDESEFKVNYFDYILLTSDETWLVKNCHYYQDPETGETVLNTLLGSTLYNRQRQLNDILNIQNSPETNDAYLRYKAKYSKTSGFYLTLKDSITHDGKSYVLKIDNKGVFTINGKSFETFILDSDMDVFIPFINETLHVNMNKDSKLFINYMYVSKQQTPDKTINLLLLFCTELIHGLYAVAQINKTIKEQEKPPVNLHTFILDESKNYYSSYYGDIKVNFNYRTIDIVPFKQLNVCRSLTEALAISDGTFTATQVTDAAGKALGTNTPSRVISNYEKFFDMIRNKKDAPSQNFIIIKSPNALLDVQTVRELKTSVGDSKTYNKFNTREFLESSLLYDFLGGILGTKDSETNLLKSKGIIAITPSVNSDKNTISKLIIDLKPLLIELHVPTKGKLLSEIIDDFITDPETAPILKNYIDKQLGEYYSLLIKKIESDYSLLSKSTEWIRVMGEDFIFKYNKESFDKINKRLELYGINARAFFNLCSLLTNVKLNEQLHFVMLKEGQVGINNALWMLENRYNGKLDELTKHNMPNSNLFWKYKNSELVLALINNKCSIDVINNRRLFEYMKRHNLHVKKGESWISESGKLLFGKYRYIRNGKVYEFPLYNERNLEDLENIPEIQEKLKYIPLRESLLKLEEIKKDKECIKLINKSHTINVLLENFELNNLNINPITLLLPKIKPLKLKNNLHILANSLVINPLIEKYNLLDYLYSLEFILSTVGTHINHPNKKSEYSYDTMLKYLTDEANRYLALHKRNVAYTASMHVFRLDQLNGVPTQYNIACVQDINDLAYNLEGDLEELKPFDGSTFVNPFMVILENNSLNGEKAGIHKKLFAHFYDEDLGTGGIIKTAGFGITNSWMRNSPFLERMMRNMTDIRWENKEHNQILIDITLKNQDLRTSYDDDNFDVDNLTEFDPIYYKVPIQGINNKWHNTYIKISKIEPVYKTETDPNTGLENIPEFTGQYVLYKQRVDANGRYLGDLESETTPIIDTNYKVWKHIFKGLDSVNFNNKGVLSFKRQSGESSIINTVHAINQCGYLNPGFDKIDSLTSFYLPMKYSDTHYIPTEGSVKLGIANFNTKDVYYKEFDDSVRIGNNTYNRYKINAYQIGILLDKEHHADNSEISMMTQVISACASLGYSWNESNKLYQALYNLTKQGIAPLLEPLEKIILHTEDNLDIESEKLLQKNKEELLVALTNLIVKNLANGSQSKDGVIFNIASDLIEMYRDNKKITFTDVKKHPLPLSDPSTFKKVLTAISTALTSSAIKMKFKGILSVLVPSHEIMKLYGEHLKGDFINFEEEIKELLSQYDLKPLDISRVQIGHHYKILGPNGLIKTVLILAPYMTEKHKKNIYGDPNTEYVSYYDLKNAMDTTYANCYFVEDITKGRNLGAYFCTFDVGDKHYNFYDLDIVKDMYIHGNNAAKRVLLLKALVDLLEKHLVVIDGQTLDITNIEITPYEVIMPKTMAELLGLNENDNLQDLIEDKKAFTKKLVNNLVTKIDIPSAYTVALKCSNGNHIYVLSRKQFEALHPEGLKQIDKKPQMNDVGEIYNHDELMNNTHSMSSIKDEFYSINNLEVIVTDNVLYYVSNMLYNTMSISDEAFNILGTEETTIYNQLMAVDDKVIPRGFKSWKRAITRNEDYVKVKDAKKRNALLSNIRTVDGNHIYTEENKPIDKFLEFHLLELGNELYTSFKKSLDIIAARIPAQSMQSFMPMRVVGYEDFDINTAYVSTHQIWLLGSDYDIDAVSLLTYVLGDDGKFIGWSPLFDYSSEEALKLSVKLDYPTGEDLMTVDYDVVMDNIPNFSLSQYIITLIKPFSLDLNKERAKIINLEELVKLINDLSSQKTFINYNSISSADMEKAIEEANKTLSKDLQLDIDKVRLLFSEVEYLVNKHNNYINTSKNVSDFTKNYVVLQMFDIAMDPRNLLLALMSVDQTTGGPKEIANRSVAGELLKSATPGNVANKYQSIEDNHVGKEVIGISAVGLKAFFGLTLYVNTVLNTGNAELITSLLAKPLIFGGEAYYTIANANYKHKNPNLDDSLLDEEILTRLNYLNAYDGNDAALLLSALLSLATDNAKELCLAKLNANADMAGMYLYGLSMGISFEKLGKLLMSDIGDIVASLMKGSVITDRLNIHNIDQAIQHIQHPIKNISAYYYRQNIWKDYTKGVKSGNNVWRLMCNMFAKRRVMYIDFYEKCTGKTLNETQRKQFNFNLYINAISDALQEGTITLQEALRHVKILRNLPDFKEFKSEIKRDDDGKIISVSYKGVPNAYLVNLLLDDVEESLIMSAKVAKAESETWPGAFNDFINLYKGTLEFSLIGSLFGTNQGVKNNDVDYLKFVVKFENIIKDLLERNSDAKLENNEDAELNFERFMIDPVYQKKKIETYDHIKFSFNPLDVILKVPHYKGYLTTVSIKHSSLLQNSIRYRTMYSNLNRVNEVIGNIKFELKLKSLSKLVEFKLINNYFNSKVNADGTTGAFFYIPKGFKITELENSNKMTTTQVEQASKIYLGTLGGNATFKNWVESEVIPNLKKGILDPETKEVKRFLLDNEFIQKLYPNSYSLNPSKNNSISWTLDINMSPRDPEDVAIVDRIRQQFDSLSSCSYSVTLADGTKFKLPVKDIFFYYNLITYNNANGEKTLTKIFDNYVNSPNGEYQNYLKSVFKMDFSDQKFNISNADLINWVALIESPYSSYSTMIYYRNNDKLKVELLTKLSNAALGDEGSEIASIGGFALNSDTNNLDNNLILTTPSIGDILDIEFTKDNKTYIVSCDPSTRKIYNISVESKEGVVTPFEKKELKQINELLEKSTTILFDFMPETGYYVLRAEDVRNWIEQKINCKN